MDKAFVVLAVLFSIYVMSEGLTCYHCYTSDSNFDTKDSQFVPCKTVNWTESNTWVCPNRNSKCIYEEVEIESTRSRQIWKTCSNGISDPCDPNALPPGVRMVGCSYCGTDLCNWVPKENGGETTNFTININANINLFIRQ